VLINSTHKGEIIMELTEIKQSKINKIIQYQHRVGTDADPVCIQAAITDICFNKCLNCNHHLRADKKIISGKSWIEFLSSHKGIESVAYLGGDLMTHPDVNEIMEYHLDSGVSFGMVICGYIPPTVNMRLLSYAKWVRVSLDTVDSDTYKRCRGGVGLSKVLNSISKAKRNGVNTELCITVSRHNINNISEIFDYAISMGIGAEIHPMFGSEFLEKTVKVIDEYEPIFESNGLEFSFFCYSNLKFKRCVAPYYQVYIDTDGDIYPCCASSGDLHTSKSKMTMGNISDWNGFLRNRETHTMKYFACKDCCDNTTRINHVVESNPIKNNFF